jgi:serine/threonine protein phosphatase PrpC
MVSAFPDVTVTDRSPEDEYILLACDGLWDVKTTEEAIDEVNKTIYNSNF